VVVRRNKEAKEDDGEEDTLTEIVGHIESTGAEERAEDKKEGRRKRREDRRYGKAVAQMQHAIA